MAGAERLTRWCRTFSAGASGGGGAGAAALASTSIGAGEGRWRRGGAAGTPGGSGGAKRASGRFSRLGRSTGAAAGGGGGGACCGAGCGAVGWRRECESLGTSTMGIVPRRGSAVADTAAGAAGGRRRLECAGSRPPLRGMLGRDGAGALVGGRLGRLPEAGVAGAGRPGDAGRRVGAAIEGGGATCAWAEANARSKRSSRASGSAAIAAKMPRTDCAELA